MSLRNINANNLCLASLTRGRDSTINFTDSSLLRMEFTDSSLLRMDVNPLNVNESPKVQNSTRLVAESYRISIYIYICLQCTRGLE